MGLKTTHVIGADDSANSGAAAASLIILAAPGRLYSLTGFNNKATDQYIQLHDSATVPANGVVPKLVVTAYAGLPFNFDFGDGRLFTSGIVVCNSSTTLTKTLGAADCLFDATFRRSFIA